MNNEEIISVLKELHKISGFRISLHDKAGREIAAYPECESEFCRLIQLSSSEREMCIECDKNACNRAVESGGTVVYRCRHGLTEAVSPLYNFGTLSGFLMMGQVLDEKPSEPCNIQSGSASEQKKTAAARAALPVIEPDMIESYIKIMTICAEYLTLTNRVRSERPTIASLARALIYDRYSERIGIKEICTKVGCSKSALIASFKKEYGTTVNRFLNDVRLEEAQRMLLSGDKPISEVALESGFSDQSYFSKVFSQRYGIPPSEYKTKHEENKEI